MQLLDIGVHIIKHTSKPSSIKHIVVTLSKLSIISILSPNEKKHGFIHHSTLIIYLFIFATLLILALCSMYKQYQKSKLLHTCYICGVAAHFFCHAFCSQRDIAHLFIIAMFADFAVLYSIKINKLSNSTNKKSRQ